MFRIDARSGVNEITPAMIVLKRIAVVAVVVFIVVAVGLSAYNVYLRLTAGDGPPPIIYERSDRPSRA
ncbi:hypothetical protein HNQ36_002734 [Afipia massiliensis]|uniref:Uncharacterized protein n=1 Tax=Afipia massiliensis TaxID=211460 RepID=A0A840N136_9BRAD|nr:hypothetical protein [Afipia massiliensis]MBB5052760.1 hypothetical protein [Afipia massiliensis]